METFVVRVWLPDRPGALGAVASRIGAVGGDVVALDILERDGGLAVDELAVQLPSADVVDLLVAEIGQVDGVAVEEVRPADALRDPRVDALESAAELVAARDVPAVLSLLCEHAARDFAAGWAAVLDPSKGRAVAAVGPVPPVGWLVAFVEGCRMLDADTGPDDTACATLPCSGLSLVLGREGVPFRARERRQAVALARIADLRAAQLSEVSVPTRGTVPRPASSPRSARRPRPE